TRHQCVARDITSPHYRAMSVALLIRRLAASLTLLWLVISVTFVLIRLAPGDPASFLVSPSATPADAARLRESLGLDRPLPVQYARWLGLTLRGDLRTSLASGPPV